MEYDGRKVLLKYLCGSEIYGLGREGSDRDYVLVLDGIEAGPIGTSVNGEDAFVFGREQFRHKYSLDRPMPEFFAIGNLDWFLLRNNIEFIDDSYREELEEAMAVDWGKAMPRFLSACAAYFGRYLEGTPNKRMYLLYLILDFAERAKETGRYELDLSGSAMEKARRFRADGGSRAGKYRREFRRIVARISELAEEE